MMTVLWIILGVPALVLLCSWEALFMMALDKWLFRRNDDKPARRRRIVR
jgi:flagellar basal body-associated protein FliL